MKGKRGEMVPPVFVFLYFKANRSSPLPYFLPVASTLTAAQSRQLLPPASLLCSSVLLFGSCGVGPLVSRGPSRDARPWPARPRGAAHAETAADPTGLSGR